MNVMLNEIVGNIEDNVKYTTKHLQIVPLSLM